MRIGIIGAGHVGRIPARNLADRGHQVAIANLKGPDSLTEFADGIGATPVSIVDAAKAGEVVILVIPTKAVSELPRGLFANVRGSVVPCRTGGSYQGSAKMIHHGFTGDSIFLKG